jgi:uncharacterized membrane protein (DUF485 family)
MVPWLSRPSVPRYTLAATLAITASIIWYLGGADDRFLRTANLAFSNQAVVALALATLWPHSVPSPKRIGAASFAMVTRVAHHLLFAGYLCAFCHYLCSFVLLADADYLAFAKGHPAGVIVAIAGSLFVVVLSVQCLAADSKVKAFAIRINGIILLIFTSHLSLLTYEKVLYDRAAGTMTREAVLAIASFIVCLACLAMYARRTAARRAHARRAG